MDCNELLDQLPDYLDQETRDDICQAIEDHLARCPDCKVHVDTIRKTIVLYQSDREVPMPPAVSSRLQAALSREYARLAKSSHD